MIELNQISETFVNEIDRHLESRGKPRPEYIADYVVSLLPDSLSGLLDPVSVDKKLFETAKALKSVIGESIQSSKSALKPDQVEALEGAYSRSDGELRLLRWDSLSVGQVLEDMIYDDDISTIKIGDTLAEIVQDRINHAKARSVDPTLRLHNAVNPLLKTAIFHLKTLPVFEDIKSAANEFTNTKRGLEARQQSLTYS